MCDMTSSNAHFKIFPRNGYESMYMLIFDSLWSCCLQMQLDIQDEEAEAYDFISKFYIIMYCTFLYFELNFVTNMAIYHVTIKQVSQKQFVSDSSCKENAHSASSFTLSEMIQCSENGIRQALCHSTGLKDMCGQQLSW